MYDQRERFANRSRENSIYSTLSAQALVRACTDAALPLALRPLTGLGSTSPSYESPAVSTQSSSASGKKP